MNLQILTPIRAFAAFAIIAFVAMIVDAAHQKKGNAAMKSQEYVAIPAMDEGDLMKEVDAERARLRKNGAYKYVSICMRKFPTAFKEAARVTGVDETLLLGIAANSSNGCRETNGGEGNVMRIESADARHFADARAYKTVFALKGENVLSWRSYVPDNVLLGAVIVRDYMYRTGSLLGTLRAYHQGPNDVAAGENNDRYAITTMAHTVFASRLLAGNDMDGELDMLLDLPITPDIPLVPPTSTVATR